MLDEGVVGRCRQSSYHLGSATYKLAVASLKQRLDHKWISSPNPNRGELAELITTNNSAARVARRLYRPQATAVSLALISLDFAVIATLWHDLCLDSIFRKLKRWFRRYLPLWWARILSVGSPLRISTVAPTGIVGLRRVAPSTNHPSSTFRSTLTQESSPQAATISRVRPL